MVGRKLGVKSKTQSVEEPKKQRLQLAKQNRQEARSNAFGRGRNIALDVSSLSDVEEENTLGVGLDLIPEASNRPRSHTHDKRRLQLEAWRKQRQEEKLSQCRPNQKPVFKVGVVHHPANPWSLSQPSPLVKKRIPAPKVKSTFSIVMPPSAPTSRATTRNMTKAATTGPLLKAVPNSTGFKAPRGIKPVVLTVPVTPRGIAQRKKALFHGIQSSNLKLDLHLDAKSKTPINFKACASFPTAVTNPKSIMPKLSLTSEETVKNATDTLPSTSHRTPPHYSPYVTVRRGKYNNRKSKNYASNGMDVSPNEKPTGVLPLEVEPVTSVIYMPSEKLSVANPGDDVTESEKDAIYFRNLLDSEILRLSAIADQWEAIKSELSESISEDVVSHVDLVTGQTRLLIRSKFEQFRKLTYDCEIGTCIPPVLPIDLQGFWDMIYMQVEGLDKQYLALTELKSNNWLEKTNNTKQKKKKTVPNQGAKRAALVNTARTGLRAVIEAARKKKMESERIEARYSASAGTLVNDPRIPDINATPENSSKRMSLLKQVLSTGAARRAAHSSPILMKVSQNAKNIGSPTAVQFKTAASSSVSISGSTPFKGILKDTLVNTSAQRPSQKSVNFGSSTRKSLLPDLDEPVIIVEEAIHMLPPPPATQLSLLTKSIPAQRKPRQSILDRLNLRGMMQPFAINESAQNNNATSVVFESSGSPAKTRKRQSRSALIDDENTPTKQRRLSKKTPHSAKQVEEAIHMLPPPPATQLSLLTKSIPAQRKPRQSILDRLNLRGMMQPFAINESAQNNNATSVVFESSGSPAKTRKRQSRSALIDDENTPTKQRRLSKKTPHSAKQAFKSADSPSMARKSKSITPLIGVENIANKQRKSYRKTPHKAVEPCKPFESADSPSMAGKDISITPMIGVENIANKQRRSYRKTPHKAVEPVNRISLFGGLEQLESLTPPPVSSTATGNLISFDTPVRRSTRLESRK